MRCTIEVEPKRDDNGMLYAEINDKGAGSGMVRYIKIAPDMNPVGLDDEAKEFLEPGREWVEKEAKALCASFMRYPAWDEIGEKARRGYRAEARYMAGRMADALEEMIFAHRECGCHLCKSSAIKIAKLRAIAGGGRADAT